jgi:hypothetical protein
MSKTDHNNNLIVSDSIDDSRKNREQNNQETMHWITLIPKPTSTSKTGLHE